MKVSAEDIYNAWLRATALANKRPYKRRKDFSALSEEDRFALDKLGRIFSGFPGINVGDYFGASYQLYEADAVRFIPLKDFATPKAVRNYVNYCGVSPKKDAWVDRMMRGFSYIFNKCVEDGVSLASYIAGGEGTPDWVPDYLSGEISIENIICFNEVGFDVVSAVRKKLSRDEMDAMFNGSFSSLIEKRTDELSDEDRKMMVSVLKGVNSRIKEKIS